MTQDFFTFVDDEDYCRLNKHKWHVSRSANNWYARTTIDGKIVYMHRFIMKAESGKVVHHKDGDTMNNQKDNLEVTTQDENLKARYWS